MDVKRLGGGQNYPPRLKSTKIITKGWNLTRLPSNLRTFRKYQKISYDVIILLMSALFSSDVTTIWLKLRLFTKIAVTFESLIVSNWFTTHFVAMRVFFIKNNTLGTHLASLLLTSALFQHLFSTFWEKNRKKRHMASHDVTWPNFNKILQKSSFS